MQSKHLKWRSLAILVLQNSSIVLVMRYSRSTGVSNGTQYLASTAVVMAELLKLLISLAMHWYFESRTGSWSLGKLQTDTFGRDSAWKSMMVPAVLYYIQNNFNYQAISLMDAATYSVSYQFKILTTAFFAVVILKKELSLTKWISLCILTGGIALVQLSGLRSVSSTNAESPLVGLVYVALACFLSGLAGIWFEYVLKETKTSLYVRNIQLSLFSILPGLYFGVYGFDREAILADGFFKGYTVWTWMTILDQAAGGLIVAVVVRYADNILKGFATAVAVILSCLVSTYLFDFQLTLLFGIGTLLVLLSSLMYGIPDADLKQLVTRKVRMISVPAYVV